MGQINTILFGGDDTALHIAALIQPHQDIVLLASTPSPDNLLKVIGQYHPQITLLTAAPNLPNVVPLISRLSTETPHKKCIVLAEQFEFRNIRASIAAGAMGYLALDERLPYLDVAIRLVHSGKATFAPEVMEMLRASY